MMQKLMIRYAPTWLWDFYRWRIKTLDQRQTWGRFRNYRRMMKAFRREWGR